MPINFTVKWDRLDGTDPFLFVDPYGIITWGGDSLSQQILTTDAPGTDGEYQGDGFLEPRVITLAGRFNAADPDTLRGYRDALYAALVTPDEGRLYKSDDRFTLCRFAGVQEPDDDGSVVRDWKVNFRAKSPLFYSETTYSQNINQSGNTTMVIGGNYKTALLISIVITALTVGATIAIQVANASVITTLVLKPSATGNYTIDFDAGTCFRGGTDAISELSGAFPDGVYPSGTVINTTITGTITVTTYNAQWRQAFTNA